jgi:hypothetical protein
LDIYYNRPSTENALLSLKITTKIIEKYDQFELNRVYPYSNEVAIKNYLQEKVEDIIKSFESEKLRIITNIKCRAAEKLEQFLKWRNDKKTIMTEIMKKEWMDLI